MNRVILLLFLLILKLQAQVVPAPHFKTIQEVLSKCEKESLVVFDIDWTLLMHEDQVIAPCGLAFLKEKFSQLSKERVGHYFSLLLLQSKTRLIHPEALDLLQQLKEKGVKVIALTASKTGDLGQISDMVKWRHRQLKELKLDFSTSFPGHHFVFHEFDSKPDFREGVLCCGHTPKGIALKAFLQRVSLRPTTVYFIDDQLDYIASVEKELELEGIPHISLHTLEALTQVPQFDLKVAEFQWDYFVKHETWLSDSQAKELLSCAL